MSCLRQHLKGSKLQINTEKPKRLAEKGLPVSLTLEMDIDPEKELGELIECNKGYAGFKYPDDVCKWFSAAIDKDVVVLRSPMTRKTKINPKRLIFDKSDVHKTFTTDAALHIINKASVEELESKVRARYPDGLDNFYISSE